MTYVPHAINRALERYGLKLTTSDLIDMTDQCKQGTGRLSYLPDGKERHLLFCHGKAVVVIYAPESGRHGKIVTVLPKEAAMPGSITSPATKPNRQRARPRGKAPRKARQQRGY